MSPDAPTPAPGKHHLVWIGLALLGLTALAYEHLRFNDFVDLDDEYYLLTNPQVRAGLTWQGFRWAWTTDMAANTWQPLSWLSYQLDAQLFGLNACAFHLENLLLHGAGVVCLFLVLHGMTGQTGRSALVAALYAVHPQHVEAVAWAFGRRDVLSNLCWILTLWAYLVYWRRPGLGRYLLVVLVFGLGLLTKPMGVTLPCVLLLLDWWPLGRLTGNSGADGRWQRGCNFKASRERKRPEEGRTDWQSVLPSSGRLRSRLAIALMVEKLPLFALAGVLAAITLAGQRQTVIQPELLDLPLGLRCGTALTSMLAYLGQTFWPFNLLVFHLYPESIPLWKTLTAGAVLGGITVLVLGAWRRPWLAVGWLWFLGTLVPVSGIILIGEHGMADRYTCVPHIGLFILVVWETAERLASWRWPVEARTAIGVTVLGVLTVLTWNQVGVWRNSYTLWEPVLERDPGNYRAHASRGRWLLHRGHAGPARAHFEKAVRLRDTARTNYDLGVTLMNQNDPAYLEEAGQRLRRALELQPIYVDALVCLGQVRLRQGKAQEAIGYLEGALQLQANAADIRDLLAAAQAATGHYAEAAASARKALELLGDDAEEKRKQIQERLQAYEKGQPWSQRP